MPEGRHCEGGASARVGGPENATVRYQFDIGQTARECDPQGDRFSLKVGVSGHLLIGPAGSPGAYSAPLRVTVTRETDQKPAFAKVYKVAATPGAAQAPFHFVTEPIVLPMTRTELADDYSILVSFENGPAAGRRSRRIRASGAAGPDARIDNGALRASCKVSQDTQRKSPEASALRRRRRNRPGNAQANGPLGDDALESGGVSCAAAHRRG